MAGSQNLVLNVTPAPIRSVLYGILKDHPRDRFIEPLAGSFAGSLAAVKAGYRPEQIETSDLSLQTGVIGYLLDPRHSLDELNLTDTPELRHFTKDATSEADRAAGILLTIRWLDTPPTSVFGSRLRDNLWNEYVHYRSTLLGEIERIQPRLAGLRFDFRDVRDVIPRLMTAGDATAYLGLPTSSKAYMKTFARSDAALFRGGLLMGVGWEVSDSLAALDTLSGAEADIIAIAKHRRDIGPGWEKVAAFDGNRKVPSPVFVIRNHTGARKLARGETATKRTYNYEIYDDHEITPETRISFVLVDEGTALYYRDLFVHKMGSTGAYTYLLATIDNQAVGVWGLMPRELYSGGDSLGFSFGIVKSSKRYPKLGRMLRDAVTTTAFRDEVMAQSRGLHSHPWAEVTSTTYSAGPTPSQDRGIFVPKKRELLKTGIWKIGLAAQVKDKTYQDCVLRFLKGEAERAKAKADGV